MIDLVPTEQFTALLNMCAAQFNQCASQFGTGLIVVNNGIPRQCADNRVSVDDEADFTDVVVALGE